MTLVCKTKRLVAVCLVCSFAATSNAQQPAGQPQPNRPAAAQPAQEPPPSQQLMQVLIAWENSSKNIQTLSGNHHRIVYDLVFAVEKHADGKFFYEAPDKGRIDIVPSKIPQNAQSNRKKDGVPFTMKPDIEQKWICDGGRIIQLSETQKTAEVFNIPESGRGQNIMNGPLPFLFGMPAQTALKRYRLSIVSIQTGRVTLKALPRWQQDSANWKEAMIMLNSQNFLPMAVQLTDPTGNSETVYTFKSLAPNKGQSPFAKIWPTRKWYNPDLKKYNIVTKAAPDPERQQLPPVKLKPGEILVPSMIGLRFQDATDTAKAMGLEVKFLRGAKAATENEKFVVYKQNPPARSVLKKGGTLSLTLYDKPEVVGQNGQAGGQISQTGGRQ